MTCYINGTGSAGNSATYQEPFNQTITVQNNWNITIAAYGGNAALQATSVTNSLIDMQGETVRKLG